ncbi:hypothetical protein GCM10027300_29500 [Modestobacter lapidis]
MDQLLADLDDVELRPDLVETERGAVMGCLRQATHSLCSRQRGGYLDVQESGGHDGVCQRPRPPADPDPWLIVYEQRDHRGRVEVSDQPRCSAINSVTEPEARTGSGSVRFVRVAG